MRTRNAITFSRVSVRSRRSRGTFTITKKQALLCTIIGALMLIPSLFDFNFFAAMLLTVGAPLFIIGSTNLKGNRYYRGPSSTQSDIDLARIRFVEETRFRKDDK